MFYYYGSIIASIALYASTVLVIKRIKQDMDESWPAIIGSISLAFIVISIFNICGR